MSHDLGLITVHVLQAPLPLDSSDKSILRDHAIGLGLLLHDLCGCSDALVNGDHGVLDMQEKVLKMSEILDSCPQSSGGTGLGLQWGDMPLCHCFVCPCCKDLMTREEAHCHMVAALSSLLGDLDPLSQRRFHAVREDMSLCAMRTMRELLLLHSMQFKSATPPLCEVRIEAKSRKERVREVGNMLAWLWAAAS